MEVRLAWHVTLYETIIIFISLSFKSIHFLLLPLKITSHFLFYRDSFEMNFFRYFFCSFYEWTIMKRWWWVYVFDKRSMGRLEIFTTSIKGWEWRFRNNFINRYILLNYYFNILLSALLSLCGKHPGAPPSIINIFLQGCGMYGILQWVSKKFFHIICCWLMWSVCMECEDVDES